LAKSGAVVLGVIALSAALFMASDMPGQGAYEVNIYKAYPSLFWILLSIALTSGFITVFSDIFSAGKLCIWVYGLLLIVLVNIFVLSLPYLRDYAFTGQWDDVNHFGYATSIAEYERPGPQNFYPVSHLLAVAFSQITGLDLQVTIMLFPMLFYLVYLANTAFAAWTIDTSLRARVLILTLASPLVFHTYSTIFRPTYFSVCMFPLVVGWIYQTRLQRRVWLDSIPFILLLVFLPFLHPWAVISTAIITFAFGISFVLERTRRLWGNSGLFLTPVMILGITWLTWFTAFQIFGATLQRLLLSFTSSLTGAHSLADYVDKAQQSELQLNRILSLFIYSYGPTSLYLGFAGVAIIWAVIQIVRHRRRVPEYVLALSLFIVVFATIAGLSLFRDLVTASPLRISNFAIAGVPLLVGALFYSFSSGHQVIGTTVTKKHLFRVILPIMLVSASIVGIFTVYFSPLVGQPNHQLSYAQQAGIEFLVEKAAKDDKNIYTPFKGAFTLAAALNADELNLLRQNSPRWWIQAAPAHFGYELDELDIQFENPGYLWITAYERAYYTDVWPEGGRFVPEDFEKLERDPEWHKVYTSGDLIIWRRQNAK
jgi:energy-converting hydrogenase Eha subunit A